MRVPGSTYRIQFGPDTGFREAADLASYLHELGITDLYASPLLRPRTGSDHGYDIVDHRRLNPALGTEADFDAMVAALRRHGMGLLLDVVPNHMAASTENAWWRDVLEHGPSSPFADFFDIDWRPPGVPVEDRVLLPILGRRYGRALERGELEVGLDDEGLAVRYFDHRVPLDPGSYPHALETESAPEPPQPLAALLARFRELPDYRTREPAERERRLREAPALKAELIQLCGERAAVREYVDGRLAALNGTHGDPASFEALDHLLARQPYLLAFWKAATEEINYRRFFNISDLVSLRMERPEVFHATHERVLGWLRDGAVTGLRIDHVDGLYDPVDYLERLRAAATAAAGELARGAGAEALSGGSGETRARRSSGGAEGGGSSAPYVIVEKILSGSEQLPAEWPAAGTTGYDFLNTLNGIFVDPAGLARLDRTYVAFTRVRDGFEELVYRKKRQIMDQHFAGELAVLARSLRRLAAVDRHGRDLSTRQLARATAEVTACLPVYRSYVRDETGPDPDGRRYTEEAIARARRRRPALGAGAFDFLERVLLLRLPADASRDTAAAWLNVVMRWQQFTGPVMAKGLEDSALYVYNRLLSMNDVGSDPGEGAVTVAEFHLRNAERRARWPDTLNATSTHDTKRSEDVRARLDVLSDIPLDWHRRLRRWSRWNRRHKATLRGRPVPRRNEEILLYQTLLGAWPLDPTEVPAFRERLAGFVVKAAREAKVRTSWLRPGHQYEEALVAFAGRILEPGRDNRFLTDLLRFQEVVAFHGALNALAQLTIKLAAPGVPDLYQGTELWDFSLVDPDNRRPVDFPLRRSLLSQLQATDSRPLPEPGALAGELLREWRDGRIKLYVTWKGLQLRRDRPDLFRHGDYVPLAGTGRANPHLCAFARRHDADAVITAVPLRTARLTRGERPPLGERAWGSDSLLLPPASPERWRNVLTGEVVTAAAEELPLARLFASLPVALLVPDGS